MILSRLRWRLSEMIKAAMLSTPENHLLRRSYRMFRTLPFVARFWRAIQPGDDWRRVDAYVARGGRFVDADRDARTSRGAVPPFGDEAYFRDLIERIRSSVSAYAEDERSIVLVNEGLSAGGAERQIVAVLKGLRDRGYSPRFIGEFLGRAPGLDFHSDELRAAGVEFSSLPKSASPGSALYAGVSSAVADSLAAAPAEIMMSILDMTSILRTYKPATIHLWQDNVSTRHGFSALLAGTPRIVLSTRNVDPSNFTYHRPYMRAAYRALSMLPEVLFTNNSAAGALSYARWLDIDAENIEVIRNGVDGDAFRRDQSLGARFRTAHGLDPVDFVVVGVFRLSEEKRPLLWVDAALHALTRTPRARFLIAGSGHLYDNVRRRINQASASERIRLVGEVNDIRSLLAAADAMLLTSAYEGTPNALLEAQAAGLFCITTEAGGAREAIIDGVTGMVLESGDPRVIGEAIAATIDQPDALNRARIAGPEFIREVYGLERMVEETIAAYGRTPIGAMPAP